MKQFKIIILLFTILASINAFATGVNNITNVSTGNTNKINEIKNDKAKIQFTYGFGFRMSEFTHEASIGILPTKQDSIEFSFAKEYDDHIGTRLYQIRAYSLGYKRFLTRSFYLKSSLYYKTHSWGHRDFWFGNDRGYLKYHQKDIGVSIAIGNQWRWSHFTLGCDWFGTDHTVRFIERADRNNDTALGVTLGNFYLGFLF